MTHEYVPIPQPPWGMEVTSRRVKPPEYVDVKVTCSPVPGRKRRALAVEVGPHAIPLAYFRGDAELALFMALEPKSNARVEKSFIERVLGLSL